MFTTMTAQLSTPTLLRLIEYLRTRSGSKDVSEALNTALEFWLDARNELPPGADPTGVRGYQWKSLFLPEGTVLRSWSYGEHNYARVEGDKIMHDGESVSPNQFARSFARTARNAWFDLSVRRPGDIIQSTAGRAFHAKGSGAEIGLRSRLGFAGAAQIPLPHGRHRVLKDLKKTPPQGLMPLSESDFRRAD